MLTKRLDNLEQELHHLMTMCDVFLDNDDGKNPSSTSSSHLAVRTQFRDELPERDVAHHLLRNKKAAGKNGNGKLHKDEQRDEQNGTASLVNDPGHNIMCKEHEEYSSTMKLAEDFERERCSLQEDIEKERRLRHEVEDSAKHVYIKLQKVEEELQREKEMKDSLLVETLHLKNSAHTYDSNSKSLQVELIESKSEIQRISSKLQALSREHTTSLHRLKCLCASLGLKNPDSSCDVHGSSSGTDLMDFLQRQVEQLIKKANRDDSCEQIRRLTSQLTSAVGRCAKVEKEGEEMVTELTECRLREDRLKQQLHMTQVALTTMESELLKKQIEYECSIQKIESESQIDKDRASLKISEYSSVLQRMKQLLLSLRNERDESRRCLSRAASQIRDLESKLQTVQTEKERLAEQLNEQNRRISDLAQEQMSIVDKAQREKGKLEVTLRKYVIERKKMVELMGEMKHQIVTLRNKREHEGAMFGVKEEKILNENRRLDENFRVLQKVSEDQGHTISKLRGELENTKKCNFKLETSLREYESSENSLIRKVEQCEKECSKYSKYIDELEEKIEGYDEDMRRHDCDDYVESKYKQKLREMEELFHVKSKEWQGAMKEIEMEKEEAMTTAKLAVKKLEEMKETHETHISGIKLKLKQEIERIQNSQNRQVSEKCAKIAELQSELERVKLSSAQLEQALSRKIEQLQAALGICIGGSNHHQQHQTIIPLGQPLHQPTTPFHPVAAAAFGSGGVGFGSGGHGQQNTSYAAAAAGLDLCGGSTCPPASTGSGSSSAPLLGIDIDRLLF